MPMREHDLSSWNILDVIHMYQHMHAITALDTEVMLICSDLIVSQMRTRILKL